MRGKKAKKRLLEPDPKYGSVTVSKLINYIMRNGKKTIAEKIVNQAIDTASIKLEIDPINLIEQVLKNVGPLMEVRSHRVGGANYQVPFEVPKNRRTTLAFRWIIFAAKSKKGAGMAKKLTTELIDAYNNQGTAIKKKEDIQRMAESNKAFAHFARH